LVKTLVMLQRTTCPKFTSISCVYFKLQQNILNWVWTLFQKLHKKPYTTFLEKVEFFTRKLTKLDLNFLISLRFLMIFRSCRRNNLITTRSLDIAGRPLKWKLQLQCGPWRDQRRRWPDSGEEKARIGRERVGKWCRLM
jgi:hypothetical protein